MTVLVIDKNLSSPDVIRFDTLSDAFDWFAGDLNHATIVDTSEGKVYHYDDYGVLKYEEDVINGHELD